MSPIPQISDAEWLVMRVLWRRFPATAKDVCAALEGAVKWSPRTVRTLLNRLVNKGALGFTKQGREYHYTPKVSESECVRAESRSFMQRVFGGSMTPLLTHFLEEGPLSREEIEELMQILDERRGE
jgi:BlaI family transcriptional regulator, penicillinase repressor